MITTSSAPTSTMTPTSTSSAAPSSTTLPDLIFCYNSASANGISVVLYEWFADNGSLTCSTAGNDDSISGATPSDDEASSKHKFPYEYTKMGDLTKVYPGFYDCQFITQFNRKSSNDSAYWDANQGDQVGDIGRNREPTDVTTIDGIYGFCHKAFDSVNENGGVSQTLFRCSMEDPR